MAAPGHLTHETTNEIGRSDGKSLDYFSILPESVIHHILSFLPFKHIVRISVLSKTWNRIWRNYPNIALYLDEESYMSGGHILPFSEHVERIMDQCMFRKVCLHNVKLSIYVVSIEELAPVMDRFLMGAIKRKVSVLSVRVSYLKQKEHCPKRLYCFHGEPVVADSVKLFELEGCLLDDTFTCISLPHLRDFELSTCQFLGQNVLNKILSGLHELVSLQVSFCEGMGRLLSVSCKPRLKSFSIYSGREIERMEICVPSLEKLKFASAYQCSIDLASCTALKSLELSGAFLSTDYVPIQDLLCCKLPYIEELELDSCRVVDKIRISSSCLKKLVILNHSCCFPGAEIDMPNLLRLDFISSNECSPDNHFASWIVPKVEEIHMAFSVKSFGTACRAGLKGFLMKFHNYKQLKLLINCKRESNFILHENLHAVSFSSLKKFVKKANPQITSISSRRYDGLLRNLLVCGRSDVKLSLIFSSRRGMELLRDELINSLWEWFSTIELVPTHDIEHEMDSAWKSFMKNQSATGYHTATIILRRRSWEDVIWCSHKSALPNARFMK